MAPESSSPELWIGILGPLVLRVAGSEVSVPGSRRRALLATLAQARGRVVGVDRLVDTLWPDDPPDDAAQALLQPRVPAPRSAGCRGRAPVPSGRRLRARAGPGRARRDGGARCGGPARRASARPGARAGAKRARPVAWSGPPGVPRHPGPLRRGGGTRRAATATAGRAGAGQDRGRRRLGGGGGQRRRWRPTRCAKRSVLLLMQALAREGRSAEAMTVGTAYRRRLVAETGLDPGPALSRLEQDIAAGRLAGSDETSRLVDPSHGRPTLRTLRRASAGLRRGAASARQASGGHPHRSRWSGQDPPRARGRRRARRAASDRRCRGGPRGRRGRHAHPAGRGFDHRAAASSPLSRPPRSTSRPPWPTPPCSWSSTTPSTWPTPAVSSSTPSTGRHQVSGRW